MREKKEKIMSWLEDLDEIFLDEIIEQYTRMLPAGSKEDKLCNMHFWVESLDEKAADEIIGEYILSANNSPA
jgi:hypothetical protein